MEMADGNGLADGNEDGNCNGRRGRRQKWSMARATEMAMADGNATETATATAMADGNGNSNR